MKSLCYLLLFTIFSILSAKNKKDYIAAAYGTAGYYYDVNGGGTCGPSRRITKFPMTKHIPACEALGPNQSRRRLNEYETNNIVAIPARLFKHYKSDFCGKRIIVSINGKERTDLDLVVWDAYHDNGDSGLRFSSTIYAELFGRNRCNQRIVSGELSWRIVDEEIIRYDRARKGGAVCLVPPTGDTPDVPFDDNVTVPGFFEGLPNGNNAVKPIVPGLKYCSGRTTVNLPVESSFADPVIVPGLENFTRNS